LIGSYNVNQVDPRVAYQYKDATNVAVANPFFNYLTTDKFPAPCATSRRRLPRWHGSIRSTETST
jgi:hypothetical protein